MNRDDFIIHVYCLTCDEYGEISLQQRIRRPVLHLPSAMKR